MAVAKRSLTDRQGFFGLSPAKQNHERDDRLTHDHGVDHEGDAIVRAFSINFGALDASLPM